MNVQQSADFYLSHYSFDHSSYSTMKSAMTLFVRFFGAENDCLSISCSNVINFANDRRKKVVAATVARNLTTLSSMLEMTAAVESSSDYVNPVHAAKATPALKYALRRVKNKPRRFPSSNITLLRDGFTAYTAKILPCILLARELALRASEILRIERSHVDFTNRTLFIAESKSGAKEVIPLTKKAYFLLKNWDYEFYNSRYIRWISATFKTVKNRAAKKHPHLKMVRFHDLRHEAIYRLFQKNLNIKEVAAISRHKNVLLLLGYLDVSIDDISAKIW